MTFVLEAVRSAKLCPNLKCSFYIDKDVFLGFVVSAKDVEMEEEMMKAIKDWLNTLYHHRSLKFPQPCRILREVWANI